MKGSISTIAFLIFSATLSAAQEQPQQEGSFEMSTYGTAFGMQFAISGRYIVYPNHIELEIEKALVTVSEHCPYQGRRMLHSVKFGLGHEIEGGSWKIATAGEEYPIELIIGPKEEQALNIGRVIIPKEVGLDLTKYWLVAQSKETSVDVPEEKRKQVGYTYVNSCKGIFVVPETDRNRLAPGGLPNNGMNPTANHDAFCLYRSLAAGYARR